MSATAASPLAEVQLELAEFVHDPLGFVLCAYPWGQGELENESGPRKHQRKFLSELRDHLQNPETRHKPFRKAVSSGHGIGKSTELSWIIHWGLSTFEDTKVIIMAGTGDQLKTKTQPEVSKWMRLGANSELFEVNVTSIKVREPGHETTWRADFTTWSEENPQASAGAHNKGKRLIIVYDEASGIPKIIWDTQNGALTDADTEIIWIAFSQCTQAEGAFFDSVFGDQKHRWRPEIIDSRTVEGINVEEINQTIAEYGGEESDQARIRYLGLYPLAGGGKFIGTDLIQAAQQRIVKPLADDPLVVGVDLAWGGDDSSVARFRKGLDARSIKPIKVNGQRCKDPAVMTGQCADILTTSYNGEKVAMMFIDGSGVGSHAGVIVARLHQMGFKNVIAINFGDQALKSEHYVLRRDEMWGGMKDFLRVGAIDDDKSLAADMQKPALMSDSSGKGRIKLEPKDKMKKRLADMGLKSTSPDDADALALTFAMPVAPKKSAPPARKPVSAWG